ncbi:NAD(P)H-quinone oxidoreductase [Rhodovulum sp. DZ06]|uniref:NAD(P)H-quinone oxidoreductase n=1 Tax=Rhodovulum sp. DZ06 TaxID=3425126 RepID=UPI003D329C95
MPETMTAVEIQTPGGPEALVPCTRPVPAPAAGEILIRIRVAGVNRPDAIQRSGAYPPPPGASDLPGLEAAGEVAAVGAGVSRWAVGDKVCALLPGGGYAEYATCPAEHALPIPEGLSMTEAAALPENYFTVWTNVFERGRLEAGETFLVHGGSSGIGSTAIQLASHFGARVMTTVGNAEKAAFCTDLGAERVVNYRDEDFVEAAKDFTGGKGLDVILDMVGGDYIPRNVKALGLEGRLVFIAFLGGPKAELAFNLVMAKRLTLTGSTLRPQSVESKARIAKALEAQVWPLISAGKIGPKIYKSFPLAQAAEAHALMESSAHMGKIMLDV